MYRSKISERFKKSCKLTETPINNPAAARFNNLMTKIMDASFHALFVIDSKGIIQMVNETSIQVLGLTREQFIGHNIRMIMPEEHAHQHDEYLKRYMATGFKRMIGKEREVLAKRKDG